jgi:hypothetical protein
MTIRSQPRATSGPSMPEAEGRLPASSTGRIAAVDNLRSMLVAWVIGCHAVVGYTAIGGWPYDEVQEGTLPSGLEYALSATLGPTALFAMGTFFFLAGMFAPAALGRSGPAAYARSRLVRLGVPWFIFMIAIWPFFMWLAYHAAGRDLTYWQAFRGRTPFLDSGPLWFVQVLLYVSVFYALWNWLGRGRHIAPATVNSRHLLMLVGAIAAVSFVVRLWYPARSQQILDLHLWQWPQLVGMFALGAAVSGQGWARTIPSRIARRCWIAVLATIALALVVIGVVGITNFVRAEALFLGGWRWQAMALDVVEASLVVAGSVGVLSLAQRHLTSQDAFPRAAARSAYCAFVLQVPVLLTLEIAARPLPVPMTVKAVLVGTLAILGSFGLGWLLVSRTALRRVL